MSSNNQEMLERVMMQYLVQQILTPRVIFKMVRYWCRNKYTKEESREYGKREHFKSRTWC